MRLLFAFLLIISTTHGFSQNELKISMVPTGEILNEYDTLYNLVITIESTALQNAVDAELFIEGLDSNYTVQGIDVLSPEKSKASLHGNRFSVTEVKGRKKVVMLRAKSDIFTVKLVVTGSKGQSVIEKKNTD